MRYVPMALLAAATAVAPIALADDPPALGPPQPSEAMPVVEMPPEAPRVTEPPPIEAVPATHVRPAPASACRVAVLPARMAWVDRPVSVPARVAVDQVPVYETVKVPTFEERRVPEYRDVQVPVYGTREVARFEERSTPRYGAVEVPVYAEVRKPVGFSIWNPFDCVDRCLDIHLWDRCETVVTGTEVRNDVVGFDTERVPAGTATETFVSGYETRRELVGERAEAVQTGEREEQRLVGYRAQARVVEPERTTTVRECVWLPAENVTVVSSGDPAQTPALAGTLRVLTEEDYRREVASAR
jgi:hypothetical protein